MQTVSAAFSAAEVAPIAQVAAKVYIFRGNYASAAFGSTALTSGDDASGNYPGSGAIDGDRTEINVGAAVAADNGIGLSSWRSATTPSGVSPVWLRVYFGVNRTWNYVKVYNLSTNPLTAYTLQYSDDGIAWTTFATYSSAARTNGGLDIYDFSGAGTTFTHALMRILITGSTSGAANLVEIEVYNKVDVTSRCCSLKTSRKRDWKQANPMAATVDLMFDNSDRFFSMSHEPTAAELTAGFFPWDSARGFTELDEGLKVQTQLGFWYGPGTSSQEGFGLGPFGGTPETFGGTIVPGAVSAPELVNSFVGTIDSPKSSSLAGTCQITGRDGMKGVINNTISTRLKANIDIGLAVQYVLNLCNISNYEMNVETAGISLPYFFAYQSTAYSVIQQLVQAAGYASFWFDENNTATFANLLTGNGSSETDLMWTGANMGQFYNSYSSGGEYVNQGASIAIGTLAGGSQACAASIATNEAMGWQFTVSAPLASMVVFASSQDGSSLAYTGYGLRFVTESSVQRVQLIRLDNASPAFPGGTVLADVALAWNGTYTVMRDASGNFYVWQNGAYVMGPVTDATYSTFGFFSVTTVSGTAYPTITVSNVNFLNTAWNIAFSAGVLTVFGVPVNQGTSVAAEGLLAVGFSPSNAPITFLTRSANNAAMTGASGLFAVTLNSATQQGQINSPVNTYTQCIFDFAVGSGIPLWQPYYVQTNWSLTGTAESIRSIAYDSNLCDVTEEISGSLSGDSSIVNYSEVISSPLTLGGTTADVQWTATVGQPQVPISVSNPMVVAVGTINIQAAVSGGMDTTYMGASITGIANTAYGAAGVTAFFVSFGTAAGTVSISYIHPTTPIITLTITTAGTITNLQLIGLSFSSAANAIDVVVQDPISIAKHGLCTNPINNNYIINPAIAQLVANQQLIQFTNPTVVLSGVDITLTPSIQQTDLVQATDYGLDLSSAQTWNVTGIDHEYSKAPDAKTATIKTMLTALILPS